MPTEIIQWFPGHMAKTRRLMAENIKLVDAVIEIIDARIPYSSHNPEIMKLVENKPVITLLNKASLADPEKTQAFVKKYTQNNRICIATDCVTGEGINSLIDMLDNSSLSIGKYIFEGFYVESMMTFNKKSDTSDSIFLTLPNANYGFNLQLQVLLELPFVSLGYSVKPRDLTNMTDMEQTISIESGFKF